MKEAQSEKVVFSWFSHFQLVQFWCNLLYTLVFHGVWRLGHFWL